MIPAEKRDVSPFKFTHSVSFKKLEEVSSINNGFVKKGLNVEKVKGGERKTILETEKGKRRKKRMSRRQGSCGLNVGPKIFDFKRREGDVGYRSTGKCNEWARHQTLRHFGKKNRGKNPLRRKNLKD